MGRCCICWPMWIKCESVAKCAAFPISIRVYRLRAPPRYLRLTKNCSLTSRDWMTSLPYARRLRTRSFPSRYPPARRIPRKFGMPPVEDGGGSSGNQKAFRWTQVGDGLMEFGRTFVWSAVVNSNSKGWERAHGFSNGVMDLHVEFIIA